MTGSPAPRCAPSSGRVSKVLLIAFAAVAFLLATAQPSSAQEIDSSDTCLEYTPSDVTVSDPTVSPGQTITVSGVAGINDTVTISLVPADGSSAPVVLGTTTSDATGAFSTTVTIPSSVTAGRYRISVTSGACPQPAVVDVTVAGQSTTGQDPGSTGTTGTTGSTGPLPRTGSSLRPMLNVAFLATGTGALLLLAARRRTSFRH